MTDIEEVYALYFDDVFRYVLRLSNDRQIAEDVTGETFFKAMQSLKTFRGDCSVRVWLCQIAKNCYYSQMKKANRLISTDDAAWMAEEAADDSPEEQVIRREQAGKVQSILHQLPEPYREVFMWRVFAELDYKQIGDIFGKTDNWACVTYHRARKMIREKWGDTENEK